jgi:hypothetical protein
MSSGYLKASKGLDQPSAVVYRLPIMDW